MKTSTKRSIITTDEKYCRRGVVSSFILIVISIFFIGCGGGDSSAVDTTDVISPSSQTIDDDEKYALSYMWHEEKLAYDLYLALDAANSISQMRNIAVNSESQHISLVETLVQSYDINITNLSDYAIEYSEAELRSMPAGVFAIADVQTLYDDLYTRGSGSVAASLEVGCIVEVVDVDDLNHYISVAVDKQDLVDTFEVLRAGSYKHYWTFDTALKNLGVTDGCCSVDGGIYCKSEAEFPNI